MTHLTRVAVERQIQHLTMELARLDAQPPDDFGDGDIISFQKTFDARPTHTTGVGGPWTYAAIKADGKWYLTGRFKQPMSWDELYDFIHAHETNPPPVHYVTEMAELL